MSFVVYNIILTALNIVHCHVCPLYVVIKKILQREILIYLSHFSTKLVSNVMLNVPLKLCTSEPVSHLAKFIFSAQSDGEVAALTREYPAAVVY